MHIAYVKNTQSICEGHFEPQYISSAGHLHNVVPVPAEPLVSPGIGVDVATGEGNSSSTTINLPRYDCLGSNSEVLPNPLHHPQSPEPQPLIPSPPQPQLVDGTSTIKLLQNTIHKLCRLINQMGREAVRNLQQLIARATTLLPPKGWRTRTSQMLFIIFVGLVVMLSFIILLITNTTDFGVILHKAPKPESELSKSMDLATVSRVGTGAVPLLRCSCSMEPWQGSNEIVSLLDLLLPWLNHTTVYQNLQQRHPNLPLELLNGAENKRCSLLPTIFSIEWYNRHWQLATLDSTNSFFLYSAFFDPETDGKASIRLLGVSRSTSPAPAWCQIWFSSDAPPLSVKVTNIDYLDYQDRSSDRQMPYLLRCLLPQNTMNVPLAVSLTSEPCGQATNLLKVIGSREREVSAYRTGKVPDNPSKLVKGWAAAVCGPALYYYHEDFTLRLVEWLELLRAQGFSQVFLYATDVHPDITRVLHHYTHEGFVQVTDYTYPPPYMNEPDLRRLWVDVERPKMFAQENIYFTDCVLRHMHQYRFLAHLDPDEVPILPKHDNFTHFLDEVIASIRGSTPHGYRLQWSYFFSDLEPSKEAAHLPPYLWVLRHTGRQAQHFSYPTGGQFKSIYDMNAIRGVYSHGPLLCISGGCDLSKMETLPPKMAFLGHFKHTCEDKCNNIHDLTLHKYKKQVGARVLNVLSTLQLL